MRALLLICAVVLYFEFQLTSAGRGGNGRGGGGGRGGESRASSGGRSNGRMAIWERIETLENRVDMLGGKLQYFAELIQGLIKKDGECPKPQSNVFGICSEECGNDWDCPDDLKCCSNGCGHVCMKPAEEDICNQPKVAGPCKAYFPRWYYNAASGSCESFIYGGCGGNGNNFESQEECENKCAEEDICNQPKVVGRCKAYFPRWYYNAASGSCESFIYGGCGGNGNNFESQEECEKECAAPVSHCPPGTTESNPAVYCGRGGTPCEKGYDCVIAPDDTYAVCCLNPGCPDGKPVVNCLKDPCEGAVCNAYPTAKCTASYCGGCNADWTVNGDPVQCDQKGK